LHHAGRGPIAPPPPNFDLTEDFPLVGNFLSKNAKFLTENPYSKENLGALIISSVRNLQLPVRKWPTMPLPKKFNLPRKKIWILLAVAAVAHKWNCAD